MTSKNVKKERHSAPQTVEDKNLEEWAKKLAARPIPQIGVPGARNFLNLGDGESRLVLPAHSEFDIDSAIGRFTWHTVEKDKFVPGLFRNGELYFCVRMIEISILGDVLKLLPPDIYALAKLDTKPVSPVEAKLLNFINSWHCNGFYGPETFTVNDKLINLKELENLYHFLRFSYKVLLNGGANVDQDFSRCGFVRVNNDSLIPYAVFSDGEKGLPLFYFEGHVDRLNATLMVQGSLELCYLRLCCKVQGVRKDLMTGDAVHIVRLADLKGFFPKTSIFVDNCWPNSTKGKSLIPKLNSLNNGYQPSNSSRSSSGSNQNHTHPYNSSAASTGVKWNHQQQQQQQEPGRPINFQQQQHLINNQRTSAPTASSILKSMSQYPQQQLQQPDRPNSSQQQQHLINNQRTSAPTTSSILKSMSQHPQQQLQQPDRPNSSQQQQQLLNNQRTSAPRPSILKSTSQHPQQQQQPDRPNSSQQQQQLLNNQGTSAPTPSILKSMSQHPQQQQQQPGRPNNFQQQQQLLNSQRNSAPTASTILKYMSQHPQQQQPNLINRNLNGVYPNSNSPKTYSQYIQRQEQQRAHNQLQSSSSSLIGKKTLNSSSNS